MPKRTIKEKVAAEVDDLRLLDHYGLTAWAKAEHIDSGIGFTTFKKALLEVGIDFDAMRDIARGARGAALVEAAQTSLPLYAAALSGAKRFAICDKSRRPTWFGRFFAGDRDFKGDQISADMSVARKAIWLASKAREELALPAIKLLLLIDAPWMTSTAEGIAPLLAELQDMAEKLSVLLELVQVTSPENPAVAQANKAGYMRWQDCTFSEMVDQALPAEEMLDDR
jgi:hypothetical protein